MPKIGYFWPKSRKSGFLPVIPHFGGFCLFWAPRGGLFYINPSRRGPAPGAGVDPRRGRRGLPSSFRREGARSGGAGLASPTYGLVEVLGQTLRVHQNTPKENEILPSFAQPLTLPSGQPRPRHADGWEGDFPPAPLGLPAATSRRAPPRGVDVKQPPAGGPGGAGEPWKGPGRLREAWETRTPGSGIPAGVRPAPRAGEPQARGSGQRPGPGDQDPRTAAGARGVLHQPLAGSARIARPRLFGHFKDFGQKSGFPGFLAR